MYYLLFPTHRRTRTAVVVVSQEGTTHSSATIPTMASDALQFPPGPKMELLETTDVSVEWPAAAAAAANER